MIRCKKSTDLPAVQAEPLYRESLAGRRNVLGAAGLRCAKNHPGCKMEICWGYERQSYGSVSKPCTPVVHIKIAGIYGCSSP